MAKTPEALARQALANFRGANKEAAGRYLGDLRQRERATTILEPGEVAGRYDASRMLHTTLGGRVRPITHDDLKQFQRLVAQAGRKFKGGMTARQIIDLSTPEDRKRSNDEIHVALPVQYTGGRVHFVTNSGPRSNVSRHHVHLHLLDFGAAAASPAEPADAVKLFTRGALQFDCDCGRHRYWFRYIATIGGFNAGRPETGYPKIRNPMLIGVACKHVLRVLQQLTSPTVRPAMERMLLASRKTLDKQVEKLSKAEAAKIAREQNARADWKRTRVESTGEKRQRIAREKAVAAAVERSRAAAMALSVKRLEVAKRRFSDNARRLVEVGALTRRELQILLTKLGVK